jgi:hypothetical protein
MVENRTLITKSSTAMFMLGWHRGTEAPILCAQAWEIPTWNMLACRSCRQRGLAASRTIFNVRGSSVESLLFSCTRYMSKGTHSGTQVCIGQCLQLFNGVPTVPHLHYSFRKDSQKIREVMSRCQATPQHDSNLTTERVRKSTCKNVTHTCDVLV